MQLVDEGKLDLDAAGPHLPAGVPDRRRGGRRADHHAPAAQPHRRLRGRHLHRHRRRRRLRREVPRRRSHDVPQLFPPGEHVLLQQRRLLRARPPGRGAPREDVRRVPARAPLRAARPDPRRDRRRTRRSCSAPPSATSSPSRAPATSPRRSGRWPARTRRPARCSRCARATCSRFAAMHLERRQGRRRHPGARARHRRRGCTASEVDAARPRPDGRRRGASASSGSTPPTARSSATTAAPSARPRSCGSCPRPASRSRCSPTAATSSRSTTSIVGHVLDELADVDAARRCRCRRPSPRAHRREPVRRHLLRRGRRPRSSARTTTAGSGSSTTPKGMFEELGEQPERKRARPLPRATA